MQFSRFEPRGRLKQQKYVSDGLSSNKPPQPSDKSNPPPHPYRQHGRQNDYPKRRGYHPQRCAAYRQRRTQGAKDLASEFAKKSWKEKTQNPRKTITRGALNSLPVYIVGSMAVDTFKDAQNCAKDFGRCWDHVTEAFQSPGQVLLP